MNSPRTLEPDTAVARRHIKTLRNRVAFLEKQLADPRMSSFPASAGHRIKERDALLSVLAFVETAQEPEPQSAPVGDLNDVYVEVVTDRIGDHVLASTLRSATIEDVEAAQAAHAAGCCPHTVVRDTWGYLYDLRSCVTCGKGLGTV